MELLLGCGHNRDRQCWLTNQGEGWTPGGLITLDHNPSVKPEVIADLSKINLPFRSKTFDEIHAYEVLEHFGQQGDWKFFFAQFDEFARVLKDKGTFHLKSPGTNSPWVWGDPGHTRYMGPQVYYFLSRAHYDLNIGKSPMTDYRSYFHSDWRIVGSQESDQSFMMILQKLAG